MLHPADTLPTDPQYLEAQARRRAGAKLGWLIHAAVYVCVNLLLAALSAHHGRGWAVYPALGWGVGLLVHGVAVWVRTPLHGLYASLLQRERAELQRTPPDPHDR